MMDVLICPLSDPGYLYPAIAVGRELRARGHRVRLLAWAAAAGIAAAAGLELLPAADYGDGRAFGVRRWFERGANQYAATLRAAREMRADLLLTSVLCHGALLAGEVLDLPVAVLGLAAHLWPYAGGADSEPTMPALREWRLRVLLRCYQQAREQVGLAARQPAQPLTGSALLLRGGPQLEYPGAVLPRGVRHVGPCAWEPPADPARLTAIDAHLARSGKPVAYVHLGRTFGGEGLWPRLNATFTGGAYQAVVERGRSGPPEPAPGADILVVREPWLAPLVERADLVLTNATTTPVLAALRSGRPLVVAPAGSEQPLLAAACVRAGVAVPFTDLRLPQPVRDRAGSLGAHLPAAGPQHAATVLEHLASATPGRALIR